MRTPRSLPYQSPSIEYQYTASLPDRLARIDDVQERKQYLIEILLPLVLRGNERVLQQRLIIENLSKKLTYLTPLEKQTLISYARMYMVESDSYQGMAQELLKKVNVLPVSLVLAQAAIESGWGTSRFCIQGNNIFGLRTPSRFGMVPRERRSDEDFTLSVFNDLQSCVDYYIWNINTNPQYKQLRYIRSLSQPPYDSFALAQGLRNYSELGIKYVRRVELLISYNALKSYDDYRLEYE
ncbi:MAG TPA: glucosaminidase domain-containing protein [Desulfomonilia bacterium]|nr:glucosaminidase domain-containing protein [Desulfomonilia bacterium]